MFSCKTTTLEHSKTAILTEILKSQNQNVYKQAQFLADVSKIDVISLDAVLDPHNKMYSTLRPAIFDAFINLLLVEEDADMSDTLFVIVDDDDQCSLDFIGSVIQQYQDKTVHPMFLNKNLKNSVALELGNFGIDILYEHDRKYIPNDKHSFPSVLRKSTLQIFYHMSLFFEYD